MKRLKPFYLFVFALFLSLIGYSQQEKLTTIQRNVNQNANDLEQRLNATHDTLTLKSEKQILRVTFLSHDKKDSNIIDVGNHEVKIPLYHFKKGRYTIAVYTEEKIIALGVKRISDIDAPDDAIADLEESILRSSLSEEEQLNRNMEPLKNKREISRNTRLASVKAKRAERIKEEKEKRLARAKSKRAANKKRAQRNKKSAFTLATDRVNATANMRKTKERGALTAVTKVTYSLSQRRLGESEEMETRAEYRRNNLRPNGMPYND